MAPAFLTVLNRTVRRARLRVCGGRLLVAVALASTVLAVGAVIDAWYMSCGRPARTLVLCLAVAAGAAAFWNCRKHWARIHIARALEASSAQDSELFVTALEASGKTTTANTAESRLTDPFRQLLLTQAADRICTIDDDVVVQRRRLIGPVVALALIGTTLLLAAYLAPDFRVGLCRMMAPWATIAYTRIAWYNAPSDATPGEPQIFSARVSGRSADTAELEAQSGTNRWRLPMTFENALWQVSVLATQNEFSVRVYAGDGVSDTRWVERAVLEVDNAIRWPAPFHRADTHLPGFAAQFPATSSFMWRFRLLPAYTHAQVELARDGQTQFLPLGIDTQGWFTATHSFPAPGQWQARITASGPDRARQTPWATLECKPDLPPAITLVKPLPPSAEASAIETLACELSATDDWGLSHMGVELLIDAALTSEALITLDGEATNAAQTVEVLLARHPNLGPDHSVIVWAFARDVAGQRTISTPVALDITPLYEAPPPPKKPRDKPPPPPPPPEPKEERTKLDSLGALITDQREVVGSTLPLLHTETGPNTTPIAEEQQSLLERLKKLMKAAKMEQPVDTEEEQGDTHAQ